MAHPAPFIPLSLPRPAKAPAAAAPSRGTGRFALDSLVLSGPKASRRSRVLGPGAVSLLAHVVVIAAIVVLPLALGEDVLPATSEAVRAFFVPPPEVALPPPPPPPPPAGVRSAVKAAPAAPRPQVEAKFTAPIEIPETIVPEQGIDLGVEGGVPGGVEGGVPGGVVGGVVGGLPSEAPPPAAVKPVRVGGMVRTPKLLNRVNPEYPEIAKAARTSALLILEATVGTDGRVQDVKVLRGHPLFDDSAVAAVRQWRYQPLLLNGIPMPFVATVTVQFNIVDKES
jgi:protein TonB